MDLRIGKQSAGYRNQYPDSFKRIFKQGLLDFDPWIIMENENLRTRYEGLKKRYPTRDLVPFARVDGNDDVACW
ncbi:hypothetical protein GOO49_004573, partial [Salmonella enterica]|nr:hypothetical protein [Salmonella enterica]